MEVHRRRLPEFAAEFRRIKALVALYPRPKGWVAENRGVVTFRQCLGAHIGGSPARPAPKDSGEHGGIGSARRMAAACRGVGAPSPQLVGFGRRRLRRQFVSADSARYLAGAR